MDHPVIKKNPVGRPSKGKRGNFTFRVTEKLRWEIIARAAASNRSASEEIEMMLEKYMLTEQLLAHYDRIKDCDAPSK